MCWNFVVGLLLLGVLELALSHGPELKLFLLIRKHLVWSS